jgi:flagellar protein FlaG
MKERVMTEKVTNQLQATTLPKSTLSKDAKAKVEVKNVLPEIKYNPEDYTKPMDELREGIQEIVKDLNTVASSYNKRLDFQMDHELGQVVVKIIDKSTDKVIKEVPPKELQRVHQRIKQAMGLLFDEII